MRWNNSVLLTAATVVSLLTLTGFLGAKRDSPKETRENICEGNQVAATGSLVELSNYVVQE
jgi:hypothetical protein